MINSNYIESLLDSVVSQSFPDFKYRQYQRKAIIDILDQFINQNKKYVLLTAATGSGKSWIARIVAEVMNVYNTSQFEDADEEVDRKVCETVFLTKTISLQNQYLSDFPQLKKLMGASNYSCHTSNPLELPAVLPRYKHHTSCKYTIKEGKCEYFKRKREYLQSPLKCLNYAFFFTGISNYFTKGTLICDEAHSLPDYLIDASEITLNFDKLDALSRKNLEEFFDITRIRRSLDLRFSDLRGILNYVNTVREELHNKKIELEEYAKNLGEGSDQLKELLLKSLNPIIDKLEYSNKISERLSDVQDNEKDWIIDKVDSDRDLIFRVRPIFVQRKYLNVLKTAKNILLMTATGKRLIKDLSLEEDEYGEVSIPYSWPIENRPVLVNSELPPLNYNNRDAVLPKYVKAIDDIIDKIGEEDSGIIHTSSYSNAKYLLEHTKHYDRIYVPESHEIRKIKDLLVPGRFIASPAILEGISLEGDASRIQIFMKVPYPSLGDIWVSTKAKLDREWYDYATLLSVIQGSGRSIRSKDDFAVTFMLDTSFINLYKRTKHLIPDWFKETLVF